MEYNQSRLHHVLPEHCHLVDSVCTNVRDVINIHSCNIHPFDHTDMACSQLPLCVQISKFLVTYKYLFRFILNGGKEYIYKFLTPIILVFQFCVSLLGILGLGNIVYYAAGDGIATPSVYVESSAYILTYVSDLCH